MSASHVNGGSYAPLMVCRPRIYCRVSWARRIGCSILSFVVSTGCLINVAIGSSEIATASSPLHMSMDFEHAQKEILYCHRVNVTGNGKSCTAVIGPASKINE